MTKDETERLLNAVAARFEQNMHLHKRVAWSDVVGRLRGSPAALRSLMQMEATEGEPDVVASEAFGSGFVFVDCAAESPGGRRSLCYDAQARTQRKSNSPEASAVEMAEAMGVELLNESMYQALQSLGEFDLKTSSWLSTPPAVRELGGAIFGDRRYARVFIYHNGAQSYYAARGFRAFLRV